MAAGGDRDAANDAGVRRASNCDALHALIVPKAHGIRPVGQPPAVRAFCPGFLYDRSGELVREVLVEPCAVHAPTAQDDDDIWPMRRVHEGEGLEEARHAFGVAPDLHCATAKTWRTLLCVERRRILDVLSDVA